MVWGKLSAQVAHCALCRAWYEFMYIILYFHFFTYVELQHGHVVRNPKKESHMAQPLDPMLPKYVNYLKFMTGKCCHLFHGQFFFRYWISE